MSCAFTPDQFAANWGSGTWVPSLTRTIAKPIPAPATLFQLIVPLWYETSTPSTRFPPTGPLGSARGLPPVPVGGGLVPGGFVPGGLVPGGFVPVWIGAFVLDEPPPPPEPPHPTASASAPAPSNTFLCTGSSPC